MQAEIDGNTVFIPLILDEEITREWERCGLRHRFLTSAETDIGYYFDSDADAQRAADLATDIIRRELAE